MVVTLVRVDFGDAQGQEGEGEQLETVLKRGAIGDLRQKGVLGTGFFVGWALESTEGSFDCNRLS
jgi:hypothetical protein